MLLRSALVNTLAALAALSTALGMSAATPAQADGMPAVAKTVKYVAKAKPRYRVGIRYVRGPWPGGPDPYAYASGTQGYYPYYNSNLWVPRKQMAHRSRYPNRLPGYSSSWGYPIACKLHGRRHCGVPFKSPAGDPRHYYRRDVQLPARTQHH